VEQTEAIDPDKVSDATLAERYARGDISREEYLQALDDLR
jgi:uncharacterized membrane protein